MSQASRSASGSGSISSDGAGPGRGRSAIVLALRLLLPIALLVYAVAFFNSISDLRPDSRYYPQFMIVLLVPLLLWEVGAEVAAWLREKRPVRAGAVVSSWWPSVYVTACTMGFILLIGRIGFYEAIVPYVLLLLPGVGVRRPLVIVAFTVGAVVGMYLLFGVVLGVRVPRGVLGL
jgi:hypothetical protein